MGQRFTSLMSHKNVIKVVWHVLMQLSSLNITCLWFQVSVFRCQLSEDRSQTTACEELPSARSGPELGEGSRVEDGLQKLEKEALNLNSVICPLSSGY